MPTDFIMFKQPSATNDHIAALLSGAFLLVHYLGMYLRANTFDLVSS